MKILRAAYKVTIWLIVLWKKSIQKSFITVFKTSESKPWISRRSDVFDDHGHFQRAKQLCDSWPMPEVFLPDCYRSAQPHEQTSTTWCNCK